MPLTDARCRSAQPGPRLQKLTDGGGLQLWLQPTGARLWRFGRFDGKQKLLALGVYPTVPLARARHLREDARRLLADGLDPSLDKKRRAQAQADAPTFRGIADEYVAKLRREKRSEATMARSNGSSALPTRSLETNQSVRSRLPPFWECCDLLNLARDTNRLAGSDRRSEAYSDTRSPPPVWNLTRPMPCGAL